MASEYVKCSGCKCLRHITDEYEVYKGMRRKNCKKCKEKRNKYKCIHGKQKAQCKDCGGTGICEHGRVKFSCKECGGSQICHHGRAKFSCKDCGGSRVCPHARQYQQCKECGGTNFCSHGHEKNTCKECDPSGHLKNLVSAKVRHALKSEKSKKQIEYLGCTIDEFKKHIENQFETGMNWDNYGEVWQIDHVVPIKYAQDGLTPSLEDTIERLHWSNTKPLFSEENKSKGC
jgi:hypothetical protein